MSVISKIGGKIYYVGWASRTFWAQNIILLPSKISKAYSNVLPSNLALVLYSVSNQHRLIIK
jgi:hypothetical protein